MKKSLTFYMYKGWNEQFYKSNGWTVQTCIPDLYVNKEHIKNLDRKEYRRIGNKIFEEYQKVRVTIETISD